VHVSRSGPRFQLPPPDVEFSEGYVVDVNRGPPAMSISPRFSPYARPVTYQSVEDEGQQRLGTLATGGGGRGCYEPMPERSRSPSASVPPRSQLFVPRGDDIDYGELSPGQRIPAGGQERSDRIGDGDLDKRQVVILFFKD